MQLSQQPLLSLMCLAVCVHVGLHRATPTPRVFQSTDRIGKESYASQEACPLSFMDLFVVPYADGDGVCFSNVAVKQTNKHLHCSVILDTSQGIIITTSVSIAKQLLSQRCRGLTGRSAGSIWGPVCS